MENKLAIVTSGGGMNCSYSGGVLCAIANIYNLRNPDILVGTSGSSGSLAYYIAGQYDSIKNIWTNHLCAEEFISRKRIFKIMDIDYLVDVVFQQKEPMNVQKIQKSKSRFFIAATDYKTGKTKFFTNTDDILEALRASKAAPLVFNKKVSINNHEYIDGSLSASHDIIINKAIKEGAKNIIFIDDGESPPFFTKVFCHMYSFFTNANVKKTVRQYCNDSFRQIKPQEDIHMIVITPSRRLKTHLLDNTRQNLEDSFFLGFEDIKNSSEFQLFLRDCSLKGG